MAEKLTRRLRSLAYLLISEPVWIILVVGVGLAALRLQAKPDGGATATLVGALFGAAAVLAGNWINRVRTQRQADRVLEERRAKLQVLIAAELVNVAVGLMSGKEYTDAAVTSGRAGAALPNAVDLSLYLPRAMPFTDSLGTELLVLDAQTVDALSTLRSSLIATRAQMQDAGQEGRMGLLRAEALSNGQAHSMGVLVDVFKRVAPDRKFQREGELPELVSDMLTKAARPPVDPRVMAA